MTMLRTNLAFDKIKLKNTWQGRFGLRRGNVSGTGQGGGREAPPWTVVAHLIMIWSRVVWMVTVDMIG